MQKAFQPKKGIPLSWNAPAIFRLYPVDVQVRSPRQSHVFLPDIDTAVVHASVTLTPFGFKTQELTGKNAEHSVVRSRQSRAAGVGDVFKLQCWKR